MTQETQVDMIRDRLSLELSEPSIIYCISSTEPFLFFNGLIRNCHVSYAANKYLVKSVLPAIPHRFRSASRSDPCTGGGA